MVIEELVKTVLSELRTIIKTETVVGKPIEVGDTTLIPVSKISVGFGAGGGKKNTKDGQGEATGGGLSIEPVAFFVVHEGKVNLVSVKKEDAGLGKFIELIPQIVEKVKDMKGGGKSESGSRGARKEEKKKS